jgi:hypothetical protein
MDFQKLVIRFAVAIGALAFFAPAGKADVTYTYTGNPFNQFGGSATCPPECNFSGFFTVAASLGANVSGVGFIPLDFSFTDGSTTITKADATSFSFGGFSTDASGIITGWNMGFNGMLFSGTNPPGCLGCRVVDGSFTLTQFAEVNDNPGVWTLTTTATPEPSSFLLLTSGLIAVGCLLKKCSA